jgi:acyl-coenzyme A thioesterase PaaI-like protein
MPATEVVLPPHHAHCFGCGGSNSAALGLVFRQVGDRVSATVTLDERHQGAPGVAHGGVLSAILDEAAGTVAFALREPAVTAQLNVAFKAPAPLHRRMTVAAGLARRPGASCSSR